jgi:hypothetical protein
MSNFSANDCFFPNPPMTSAKCLFCIGHSYGALYLLSWLPTSTQKEAIKREPILLNWEWSSEVPYLGTTMQVKVSNQESFSKKSNLPFTHHLLTTLMETIFPEKNVLKP